MMLGLGTQCTEINPFIDIDKDEMEENNFLGDCSLAASSELKCSVMPNLSHCVDIVNVPTRLSYHGSNRQGIQGGLPIYTTVLLQRQAG